MKKNGVVTPEKRETEIIDSASVIRNLQLFWLNFLFPAGARLFLRIVSGKVGTFATCNHLQDRRLKKVFAASDHVPNNVDGFSIFDVEIALR